MDRNALSRIYFGAASIFSASCLGYLSSKLTDLEDSARIEERLWTDDRQSPSNEQTEPEDVDQNSTNDRLDLEALIAGARRGPGGVPIVRVEDLFRFSGELEAAFVNAQHTRNRLRYQGFVDRWLDDAEVGRFFSIIDGVEDGWTEIAKLDGAHNQGYLREQLKANTESALQDMLGAARYSHLTEHRKATTAFSGKYSLAPLVTLGGGGADDESATAIYEIATRMAGAGLFNAREGDFHALLAVGGDIAPYMDKLSREQREILEMVVDYRMLAVAEAIYSDGP